jgi:hypothetical protein
LLSVYCCISIFLPDKSYLLSGQFWRTATVLLLPSCFTPHTIVTTASMARVAQITSRRSETANRSQSGQDNGVTAHPNSSPSPSFSDKENRIHLNRNSRRGGKRKSDSQAMPPPNQNIPGSASSTSKRRKLAEVSSNLMENSSQGVPQSQTRRSQRISSSNDFYDPDQDENERRRIRKELRDLTRDLHGMFSQVPYLIFSLGC